MTRQFELDVIHLSSLDPHSSRCIIIRCRRDGDERCRGQRDADDQYREPLLRAHISPPLRESEAGATRHRPPAVAAEAAASLEISEDLVKTRLHRARALLRENLYKRAGVTLESIFAFGNTRCDRVVSAVMSQIAT